VCRCTHTCIRQVPVFQQLTEQELRSLSCMVHSATYAKGQFVFKEGDLSNSLYVLHRGLIKLSMVADTGREHIVRFLFPGDFFGLAALLQESRQYAHAEVIEEAKVCRIDRGDFQPLLERSPAMTYRFLLAMSQRVQQADGWAGAVTLLEVERRIARLLIHFQRIGFSTRGEIRLPAAKKEIAAMIGTTPETLSRKLAQLEAQQLITMKNRNIRILLPDMLEQLAGLQQA
jgi:CRP-like cAMP-binding protein